MVVDSEVLFAVDVDIKVLCCGCSEVLCCGCRQ